MVGYWRKFISIECQMAGKEKDMKKLSLLWAILFCVVLAGCDISVQPENSPSAESMPATMAPATPSPAQTDGPLVPPTESQTAVLYVGTKAGGFTEYPMPYEGKLTPELLIQGIAKLTRWDLTLAEAVTFRGGFMCHDMWIKGTGFEQPCTAATKCG